ncbi:MAG: hypothetical protein LUB83_05035 [Prevotellaceae bacterium]|nr:hypothetical protein [Prevotellaceae bacterium]
MRSQRFQTRVVKGRFTLPVAILFAAVCWLTGWHEHVGAVLPAWADGIGGFLLHGVIGYFLIGLNNTYNIIRVRASVQTGIYLLWVAVCPVLHGVDKGNVAGLVFLMALYFLFKSYQQKDSEKQLFLSCAFLGAGSLLVPQYTLTMPLFWIGAYLFRALHPKSFLASLVGWFLPYWFLLGYAFCTGQMELFQRPFRELATFQSVVFHPDVREWITLGYFLLFYLISALHCMATGFEDKIRTRSYLQFLMLLCFCLFVYFLLQPALTATFLPLLLMAGSILTGHLFVLTGGRGSNLLFIGMLVGLLGLYVLNVWMPL